MTRTTLSCVLACVLSVALGGCYRWSGRYGRNTATQYAQQNDADADTEEGAPITDADRQLGERVVLLQSLAGQHVEVVGAVDVHEPPGYESQGLADLKARAAQLGAQGLTSVETHPPAPGENVTHFSGLAIRFNDLLRGRPYTVIGEVDVDASMLHEDEAYAELRRRARELHADLLLGVRFDHGDGTGPVHLKAQAIRILQQ